MVKIRAFDDLKYSMTNQFRTVWTPIKLPTWDRIWQMALDVRKAERRRPLLKMDHESEYKKLPLVTEQAKYAASPIRRPLLNTWYSFWPRSLLFWAEAEAAHYNCLSRAIAVLVNRIFGIPLISYFDDLWAMMPAELGRPAIDTVKILLMAVGIFLNARETDLGGIATYLAPRGISPNPDNVMALATPLPEDKGEMV